MPTSPVAYGAYVAAGAVPVTANTETVVATVTNVQPRALGQGILLDGAVNITPQAAATSITLRVRRGSLTGALVGSAWPTTLDPAADPQVCGVHVCDRVAEVNNATYVLTAQQAGAAGDATVANANLEATAS